MATNTALCINCHAKTKHFDLNTGILHDFCSKSCANASTSKFLTVNTNCENCHARPKHSDGTQTYPYCSKSCGQAAKLAGVKGLARRITIGASPIPGSGSCSIPRCYKQVYVGPDGKVSKFCNRTHQGWGEFGCLYCRLADKAPDSHLCSGCINVVQSSAPMIISIPEEHERFSSVANQFQESWRHPTTCPTVRAIYLIVSKQQTLDKYKAYRDATEARGNFVSKQRSAGNEQRRWHGTSRKCTLGDSGDTQFLNYFKKKTGWGRFGRGIYLSSTSSKSNDYSSNSDPNSPWKAILLTKVVVGKGYKMKKDDTTLTSPPAGFDSVLGEVGKSLKYDEVVVYREDAMKPSYLVMYDK